MSLILRNNVGMAEVSIYVTLITAGAGIAGATISQVSTAFREGRQAKRDRHERYVTASQDACFELLRAAGALRTDVENLNSYRGNADGLRERLEVIRGHSAEAQLHAAGVGMKAPDRLTEPAERVAAAASSLMKAVLESTDLDNGVMVDFPGTGALNTELVAFREQTARYARG